MSLRENFPGMFNAFPQELHDALEAAILKVLKRMRPEHTSLTPERVWKKIKRKGGKKLRSFDITPDQKTIALIIIHRAYLAS